VCVYNIYIYIYIYIYILYVFIHIYTYRIQYIHGYKYSRLMSSVLLMTDIMRKWTLYGIKYYDGIVVICGNERDKFRQQDSVLVTLCQCNVRRAANLHPVSFPGLLNDENTSSFQTSRYFWNGAANKTTKCIRNSCNSICGLRWLWVIYFIYV